MVKEDMIKWAKKSMEEIGGKKAIIGISGGKDSTIVAKIFVEALGKENVIGVLMPNGEQSDISDSYKVCEILGIKYVELPIEGIVEPLYTAIKRANFDENVLDLETIRLVYSPNRYELTKVTKTNTPPRIRMTVLYAIAGSISGARVINTSNRSEAYVGYCTKWGDMCGDLYPLINLTVREVLALGDELGLPYELVHKVPADGLSGKTDEDNLGITYNEIDNYLLKGAEAISNDTHVQILKKWNGANHKFIKTEFNPNDIRDRRKI